MVFGFIAGFSFDPPPRSLCAKIFLGLRIRWSQGREPPLTFHCGPLGLVALDWGSIVVGSAAFRGLSRFLYLLNQGRSVHNIVKYHDIGLRSKYIGERRWIFLDTLGDC